MSQTSLDFQWVSLASPSPGSWTKSWWWWWWCWWCWWWWWWWWWSGQCIINPEPDFFKGIRVAFPIFKPPFGIFWGEVVIICPGWCFWFWSCDFFFEGSPEPHRKNRIFVLSQDNTPKITTLPLNFQEAINLPRHFFLTKYSTLSSLISFEEGYFFLWVFLLKHSENPP